MIRKENGMTFIDGLQDAAIGAGENENSVMASLHYLFAAMGRDFSYSYLMGISGCAVRFQYDWPEPCPSSPHACVGFECEAELWKHLPYNVEYISVKRDDKDFPEVFKRIKKDIDAGKPVMLVSEENGLVVGYTDDGDLLCRPYASAPGYMKVEGTEGWNKWPWAFAFLMDDPEFAETPDEIFRNSVRLARMLWKADPVDSPNGQGTYIIGENGYLKWLEDLSTPDKWEQDDKNKAFMNQLANAHIYYCLLDARACAADFFNMMAEMNIDGHGETLRSIAEKYGSIVNILTPECPTAIAPMPWMEKGQQWNQTMRDIQANLLKQALKVEQEIQELMAHPK